MTTSPGSLDISERHLARHRLTSPIINTAPGRRHQHRELQPAAAPRVNAPEVPLAAAAAAL